MTDHLDRPFAPAEIEATCYQRWEEEGVFQPRAGAQPYCIMLPPPNVTGNLHMGHAFQDTLMDILVRIHRMRGEETLWQPGTDHAGIATQMLVERQIIQAGGDRHQMGRSAFLEKVWEWRHSSGGHITRQMRRLGASCDWTRERFTLDSGLSRAVTEVFVQLHDEGLIYRGKRLVNWDPVLRTAVSDLEVLSEEEDGYLWHIRYPLSDGSGSLVVATTRPETLLGDAAVAVHPDDPRYASLIGKTLRLPIMGREIPIIADEYVDPEFGSGCVKITPAHDFNDYQVGQRHHLPLMNVFTPDARIREQLEVFAGPDISETTGEAIPESLRGLDRYAARKQIIALLEAEGLLVKTDPHKLMVPRGDRSQAVIEPYLTDQWYVRVAPLAEPAIKAVEEGRIRFVPENWNKTYFDWMHRIEDWCISRQLWWGHQIPAWYGPDGKIFVARHEEEAQSQASRHYGMPVVLERDPDVLDTWFSSALWPFTTLGWPEKTADLARFYPGSVLVTGFDIIFFWVARMIMMGLRFMDEVPFQEVYIHGLVRDAEGQKMSKSKGNVLDPIDLIDGISLEDLVSKRTQGLMQPQMAAKIEKSTRKEFAEGIPAFGTDALRFTFTALATQGRDIKFDLKRVEGNRNFCNKLWNASRFAMMQVPETGLLQGDQTLMAPERWIIGRLQHCEAAVNHAIDQYRFADAAHALYQFFWNDYCDWYIELCKPVLRADSAFTAAQQCGTRNTLLRVLEAGLRLLHPVMPFITETLWQRIAPMLDKSGSSIALAPYPVADLQRVDPEADADTEWLIQFIRALRSVRGEMDIPPGKLLPVLLQGGDAEDRRRAEHYQPWLFALARLSSLDWLPDSTEAPPAALQLLAELKILVPLAGVIDVGAEQARLGKEQQRLEADRSKTLTKLGQESFRSRAPAEVVAKEEERLREIEAALEQLAEQAARLQQL
ncbi:valine--tRNA ligase [Acidithiobacillus montserratensis]|uniref:Valine--tRNA ligase n=1 Tax=Acidithiobacillus montserratensis TaxID=2729135 RepID=A0ACD5HCN2_9PROT|nr:valine--tRNA ligase [Acidithiobacillus montserratensis]MBN2678620.1 valine--tRNA ligase [Acidithiobacillaceae bacterium]MBU2748953.1 valine--tRNA ligase [Acidithiobacillus montserratensis]